MASAKTATVEPHFTQIWDMSPSGRQTTAVAISLLILTSIAVTVRCALLVRSHDGTAFSTGCLLAAYCLFAIYCGVMIRGMRDSRWYLESANSSIGIQTSGGTLDRHEILLPGFDNFQKYLYAMEILYFTIITLIKLSILSLYISIFRTANFRRVAQATMCLCIIWFAVNVSINIFQCSPVRAVWEVELFLTGQAKCLKFGPFLIGIETTNIFIDLLILIQPLFMIRRLQLQTGRKIACACVFMLGGLVMIASALGIYYLHRVANNDTLNILPLGLKWSTAELATAMLCACLPTYGPLLRVSGRWMSDAQSWLRSRNQSSKDSQGSDSLSSVSSHPSRTHPDSHSTGTPSKIVHVFEAPWIKKETTSMV